jgi:hypothetical protein
MSTIVERFMDRTTACARARAWVTQTSASTFEQCWNLCPDPNWMLEGLARAGYEETTARRVRQWIYRCLVLVQDYLSDPRSTGALRVLEQHSMGSATPDQVAGAAASAKAAFQTRARADAFAQRASPEFHATRAVASALSWTDDQWDKSAGDAAVMTATAVAQQPDGQLDLAALVAHRQKQADLLRMVFATEVGGFISNLKHLD